MHRVDSFKYEQEEIHYIIIYMYLYFIDVLVSQCFLVIFFSQPNDV